MTTQPTPAKQPAQRPTATAERPAVTNLPPAAKVETPSQQLSLITTVATKYGMTKQAFEQTLMSVILPGTNGREPSWAQITSCLVVAHQYDLNPFTREIHFFLDNRGVLRPIVGIDGWATLGNRQPLLDGVEFEEGEENGDRYCECIVHRKDRAHPTKVREWLSECIRNTQPWKMERRMLRHRAYIQAMRLAFGLAGIMDDEDYERMLEWQKQGLDLAAEARDAGKADKKPRGPAAMKEALAKRNQARIVDVEAEVHNESAGEFEDLQPTGRSYVEEAAAELGEMGGGQQPPADVEPEVEHTPAPMRTVRCDLSILQETEDTFSDWKDEPITTKPDKQNPLSGHTWFSAAQGEMGGGRHARLEWMVEKAVEAQARGVQPNVAEQRAAVILACMLERYENDRKKARPAKAAAKEQMFPENDPRDTVEH